MFRSHRFAFIVVLLLLTAAVGRTITLEAGQESYRRGAPPLTGAASELPVRFDLNGSSSSPAGSEAVDAVLPWARLAFQSFRTGDWEIFVSLDDGTQERRLTNHPATDTGAELDRGSQKVVFASDRDGDAEIYVMKVYGTALNQLTTNGADDFNPAWSPDGNKVAFQSYRDGQSEIYVMNADGSQQMRLTTSSAYDGLPSWSPDGQKIAFTSNRSGGWRIWVMDASGQNQTQLSNQAFSENPIWSPDGTQIAYDADGDNNGWLELWVMDASGANQRALHNPGYLYDAWAGSWSPDGRHISFTEAQWTTDGSNFYWIAARLFRWSKPYGAIYRMHPGAAETHPSWQSADLAPPSSAVRELPPYLRDDAYVQWDGVDSGDAGIRNFDVQYRVGEGGSWTMWQSDVPDGDSNAAVYPAQPGQTVFFRSRAEDNASNVETWPVGDGDAATTFYSWAITGSIRDNRNTPVNGSAATGAEAFEIWPSDDDGHFRSYFSGNSEQFTTQWEKSGYLALPATHFAANQDVVYDVVLPPADNVVQDWGFESGPLAASSWTAGGIYTPSVTTTIRHTGEYGAYLGRPFAFGPEQTLYGGDLASFEPQIARDGGGGLHALWVTGSDPATVIRYSYRPAGSDWGAVETVASGAGSSYHMRWGVADDGRVHVTWKESTGANDLLLHAWRDGAGAWSTPTMVFGQGGIDPLRLVIDDDGNPHALWYLYGTSTNDYYYASADQNGSWSPASRIGATGEYTVDDLAVGTDGRVHLLWRFSGDDILYSYRQNDGSWSPRELVFPGGYNWYHRLAVDAYGQVHVVWSNVSQGKLYHRMRDANGAWSPVRILFANQQFGENEMELALSADGTAHIVWPGAADGSYCFDLMYASVDRFGEWTGTATTPMGDNCARRLWLNADHARPFVASSSNAAFCIVGLGSTGTTDRQCLEPLSAHERLDLAAVDPGHVYAIWSDFQGVRFREPALAAESGASTIEQSIVVPDASTNPTLSFFYDMGWSEPGGGYLEVRATQGVTTTTLFTRTTATAGWSHGWVDLAPWGGQSITLTVQAVQAAGTPFVSASIDEVTVGAAHPDVWVNVVAPPDVLPGATFDFTVAYGNRGDVPAAAVGLTLTLPAELGYVDAQPAPVTITPTLTWDLGSLAPHSGGIITVTGTLHPGAELGTGVAISATIQTTTAELELLNNLAGTSIHVGLRSHLPIVARPE